MRAEALPPPPPPPPARTRLTPHGAQNQTSHTKKQSSKTECVVGFGRFIYAGNVDRKRDQDKVWPLCVRCPAGYVAPGGDTSIYCVPCPTGSKPSADRGSCGEFLLVGLFVCAHHSHTQLKTKLNNKTKQKLKATRAAPSTCPTCA